MYCFSKEAMNSSEYEEIVLMDVHKSPKSTETCQVYNYDIKKDTFERLIQRFAQSTLNNSTKVSQYDIIETRFQQLQRVQVLDDNGDALETKTYECIPVSCDQDTNAQFVTLKFKKQKIPNVCFPSTMDHDTTRYIRRLVFRYNNRVFLNFQEEAPHKCRKVYINVNNSKDAEQTKLNALVDELKKHIVEAIATDSQSSRESIS